MNFSSPTFEPTEWIFVCLYLMKRFQPEIRNVQVTRYVTPLREGGSLPAIVEADDGFLYVLKFRGAGQGVKSLIAELIGGELARVMGLHVQTSKVHPGFCEDAGGMLEKLFIELVK